jgi:hypothetical protein
MYANAEEALNGLRRKRRNGPRTGAILPERIVANNTKLMYFADELIGLKYHNTLIAMYMPDGVRIDTRDPGDITGWFTVTTWDRIDSFTPAVTFSRNGLRHVKDGPDWANARLFTHGAKIHPDGTWTGLLDPAEDKAIQEIAVAWRQKARRFANRLVTAYLRWDQPPGCCHANTFANGDEIDHYLDHFRANEPVLNAALRQELHYSRQSGVGRDFIKHGTARVAGLLRKRLTPRAIANVAPEFPYPQLTRG